MAEQKTPRDSRVDPIGYVGQLQKQHADKLKTQVKVRMVDQELERVTGDAFEGLLVKGTTRTIDPAKFFRQIERGEITQAEFLACVKVNNEAAEKVLGSKQLDRISEFNDSSPSLRVTPIKGVAVELVDALARLNEAVRGEDAKPVRVS